MNALQQIIEGWVNLTKLNFGNVPPELEAMGIERSIICTNCELYSGGICNPIKATKNVNTGRVVNGCGCLLAAKVLCVSCQCPAGKW